MAELKNIAPGILNTFEYNNRKPISLRYDNSFSTIRSIVTENAAPNILPHVHNYIGEVLFVFPEGETATDSLWASLVNSEISTKQKIQIVARIPEIHAAIPLPKSSDDFATISLYPVYTAIDNSVDRPEVGDLVLLDYKDKQSFANPIYLGKYDDQQRSSSSVSKNGTSAQSAFQNANATYSERDYNLVGKNELPTPEQQNNLNILAQNLSIIESYIDQLGRKGFLGDYKIGTFDLSIADGLATDGHVETSYHYQGKAADILGNYRNSKNELIKLNQTILWAAIMKLRSSGKILHGGVGAYVRATLKPGAERNKNANNYEPKNEWKSVLHYDIRGKDENWYWYFPGGTKIDKGGVAPKEFFEILNSLPEPDSSEFQFTQGTLVVKK